MKALESVVRYYAEGHPEDFARELEGFTISETARVLKGLPTDTVATVLTRINPDVAARLSERLSVEQARALFRRLPTRSASVVLTKMEAGKREALLKSLPEGTARRLRTHLTYAWDTAGGMMEPQFPFLFSDWTVQEVLSAVRGAPREASHGMYVTDREGRLVGLLDPRDFISARPHERIEGLLQRNVVSVPPHLDREEVTGILRRNRLASLPVVDEKGHLLGIVAQEQAVEAVQEEAFEDLQKMSGAGGDERALSPVPTVLRKRLPWLGLNLGTAFVAATVVGLFERVIDSFTALAILMPVVSAVSGNTGIQSLSVVMRGLALREITPANARRVLLKETVAGGLNSLGIALLGGGVAWAWFGIPSIAAVIGLAMVVSMVVAASLGAVIPLALKALGRDPAQSASIFLTTMTDVVGLGSFLGIGGMLLSHLK